MEGVEHGAGVDDDERDRQTHGDEHDAEAGADADELQDAEVVLALDGVEEGAGREDPPGVASHVSVSCMALRWNV